jgi:hypothetical protein
VGGNPTVVNISIAEHLHPQFAFRVAQVEGGTDASPPPVRRPAGAGLVKPQAVAPRPTPKDRARDRDGKRDVPYKTLFLRTKQPGDDCVSCHLGLRPATPARCSSFRQHGYAHRTDIPRRQVLCPRKKPSLKA